MNESGKTTSQLERAIKKGSTPDYEEFKIAYIDDRGFGNMAQMAMVMADKFNYLPAYYDVFWSFYDQQNLGHPGKINDFNLDFLKEDERNLAIKYLVESSQKGDKQGKFVLGNYYMQGRYFSKDTVLGEQLLNDAK